MGNVSSSSNGHLSPNETTRNRRSPGPFLDQERRRSSAPRPEEIYVAIYSHDARSQYEISFRKGEKMWLLEKVDDDWYKVRLLKTPKEGYVPRVYVKLASALDSQEWYFGNVTRVETHQLLMSSCNEVGAFLVRTSESGPGYTLSVRVKDLTTPGEDMVQHYRIPITKDGYPFLEQDSPFYTLNDLVEHYCGHSGSMFDRLLKRPCKRNKPILRDISWDTRDKWEIDRSKLEFQVKKGQGSFGEVWLGCWNRNVEVAIKTLKEGTMSVEKFMAEAQIMKRLNHRNILVLYAVCTMEQPILIITEYMSEGSLLDYLRGPKGMYISFNEQLYIATQIASGMAYLEKNKLVHRDLAARNVLVGHSLTCKIADFGLARALVDGVYNASHIKVPLKWTAPEALTHNIYSTMSDVWSFGILSTEILTYGDTPYKGKSNYDVERFVASGGRMKKPANCPDSLFELILKCWHGNPYDRPTFECIHDTLQNYNIWAERSYASSSYK